MMANLSSLFTLSLLTVMSVTSPATGTFWKSAKTQPINLGTPQLTHFQFYWHDNQTGSNPTTINIIKPAPRNGSLATGSLASGFGNVNMFDNPLTHRPENGSRIWGRAQGFYGLVSQEENVLLMVMTFVFKTGRYGGSTLTVLGRNPVVQKVREMPVIGGTGVFRFARGYVQATTHTINMQTRDAVVRYYVSVLHY